MGLNGPLAEIALLAYRAAGQADLWPLVMDKLSEEFGGQAGSAAVIEAHDLQTGACSIVTGSAVIDPADFARYIDYYVDICPRVEASRAFAPDVIHHDDLIGDERTLDKSEYYTDFLAPQGYRYFIGANIVFDPAQKVILSVQRPPAAGRVDEHIVDAFGQLRPHLGSAFVLHQMLEGYKGRAAALEEIIEDLPRGVVLVNKNGEILSINGTAEDMIVSHDDLAVRDRRLTALDPDIAASLDEMIANAIGMMASGMYGMRRTLRLTDARGGDLLLRAIPLPRAYGEAQVAEPAVAAVLIEELPPRIEILPARLRVLYGLTPTEAELAAAFAAGATLEEMAERRHVTIATVRTHFVRIRDKMEARNLAELMRIILNTTTSEPS